MHTRVLILGAGPAGLTASVYAARAGLNPVVLAGNAQGGQLLLTHEIENFPGFLKISGFDLVDKLAEQSKNAGAKILSVSAKQVDLKQYPFVVLGDDNENYTADALIIATGASARWLNLTGESKFKGHGISICAVCDGFFYKNKTVMVIGGGNSAVYEALYLSKMVKKVILVHRKKELKAERQLMEQLNKTPEIEVLHETYVREFKGENKLSSVVIEQNGQTHELLVDGVFEAIGQIPNTEIFKDQLPMDENGFLITDKHTMATCVAGVYACGDVQESKHRQAIVAASGGCLAALNVESFLLDKK